MEYASAKKRPRQIIDQSRGSRASTHGVRIEVTPCYMPVHSSPESGRYLFRYQITIANETSSTITLRSRHWIIIDEDGEREAVRGDGVIGLQPAIGPGESFEYESFCPLPTPWGTMEGSYRMQRMDGSTFDVDVARFYLAVAEVNEPDPSEVDA